MPGKRESTGRRFEGFAQDELIAAYGIFHAVGGVPKVEADTFPGGVEIVQELPHRGLAHVVPHTPTAILRCLDTESRFVAGVKAQQFGWLEANGRADG